MYFNVLEPERFKYDCYYGLTGRIRRSFHVITYLIHDLADLQPKDFSSHNSENYESTEFPPLDVPHTFISPKF